jgi:Icc-related predicted phosphoesterase
MINLTLMSDIHCRWEAFSPPPEDTPRPDAVLIAGDITNRGDNCSHSEWYKAYGWFEAWREYLGPSVPIYWIGGNHDFGAEQFAQHSAHLATFIQGRCTATPWGEIIMGLNMSPCYDLPLLAQRWTAMTASEAEEKAYYVDRPAVDIILSHAPMYQHLDEVPPGINLGSKELSSLVKRTEPKLLIHGHVHEQASEKPMNFGSTTIYNVATLMCNITHDPQRQDP